MPVVSAGAEQSERLKTREVLLDTYVQAPLWIESTWADDDGAVYAWYHHEEGVCPTLSAPKIGALVSRDGGRSYEDLGIILESFDAPDCEAANGYFAGGHGDFTVLPDASREYFYFYFSNYSGPPESQGIAVARMAFADRNWPAGQVFKFYNGSWGEPGLGGARHSGASGPCRLEPSGHGRLLGSLPALEHVPEPVRHAHEPCLLRAGMACRRNLRILQLRPREPAPLVNAAKLLGAGEAGWYPQVIGLEPGGSDKLAGRVARLYIGSDSNHEILFGW